MAGDILIVDDEIDIRVLTSGILEDEGFEPRQAGNSDSALKEIARRRPDLVLLDIWLQGSELDGLGILRHVKDLHPLLPVVMMSGHGTIETAVSAIKLGAYDFIEKPFKSDRLLLLLERAIDAARLRRENEELRQRAKDTQISDVTGSSPAISQVRHTVERAARANSRVLITGPAGSGKEVVARMLHESSLRSSGPFVALNCATMDPDRVELELFGTERAMNGSQDGARKVGTFEMAHNGTLFLDEIADMPLETQGKVVRVLQDQNFQRVGGTTNVQVDVRVVSASTRPLAPEIEQGRFREDLYYRLNVVPIDVPPLKARREDIPALAKCFAAQISKISGQPPRTIGDDAMAALQTHEWPGNVRELRNVIERILITAPGTANDPIGISQLPVEIGGAPPAEGDRRMGEVMSRPLREAREIFEHDYLIAQIKRFSGNVSRTAKFIGMERSALYRKLKLLGIYGKNEAEGKE